MTSVSSVDKLSRDARSRNRSGKPDNGLGRCRRRRTTLLTRCIWFNSCIVEPEVFHAIVEDVYGARGSDRRASSGCLRERRRVPRHECECEYEARAGARCRVAGCGTRGTGDCRVLTTFDQADGGWLWECGEAPGAGNGAVVVGVEERAVAARCGRCAGGRDLPFPSRGV